MLVDEFLKKLAAKPMCPPAKFFLGQQVRVKVAGGDRVKVGVITVVRGSTELVGGEDPRLQAPRTMKSAAAAVWQYEVTIPVAAADGEHRGYNTLLVPEVDLYPLDPTDSPGETHEHPVGQPAGHADQGSPPV